MRDFFRDFRSSAVFATVLTSVLATIPCDAGHPDLDPANGWRSLFNGKDLSGWVCPKGTWIVEDGVITWKGGGFLTSIEQFGDFILDLEFKVAPKANSGISLRHVPDPDSKESYWWNGLLEVQVLDSHGNPNPTKHDCGSLYDMVAPAKNTMRRPGEWNRITIVANGSRLAAMMNNEEIFNIDLADWDQAEANPDGTPNKYHKPMKDMARKGHILLQDHGTPVWYRNIHVKVLDKPAAAR